jgi:hypothetical protein
MLTPDWTTNLLEDAARADIAQRHLIGALRGLRSLPGNVAVRPHTVLRNLFEEVGWQRDLAEDPELLREELAELRRLVHAWERFEPPAIDPAPQPSWTRRAAAALFGTPPRPAGPATGPAGP